MSKIETSSFNEIPVICDESGWVWEYVHQGFKKYDLRAIKVPGNASIRHSWNRFKDARRIIVHWEGKHRSGGAIIEEILDINKLWDVGDKIIVLTTSPMREDVVYLSELGIRRVIRLRPKVQELKRATEELLFHMTSDSARSPAEMAWQRIHRAIDLMQKNAPETRLQKIENAVHKLEANRRGPSSRALDVLASLSAQRMQPERAEQLWREAIDSNPNYFRAYNNLITFLQERKEYRTALELLQRMHNLNKSRIARLVDFGTVHAKLNDPSKAEHFYNRALARDDHCSGALNGLAAIKFAEGDLERARELLAKTDVAYKFASELNLQGIKLVRSERFEEALDHYTKAQYVIPQKEKGPKLFFNIGLCYYRWGRFEMAEEFLKLALIKEPTYSKARSLLEKTLDKTSSAA